MKPLDPGLAGGQDAGKDESKSLVATSHVGTALTQFAENRNSSAAFLIAVAAFKDSQQSRRLLENEINRLVGERDHFQQKYHEASTDLAVLKALTKPLTSLRRLQESCFGLGGILLGFGLGHLASPEFSTT